MQNANIYVGTSGWNYRHWRDVFYPHGLKQAEWLPYFAEHYSTTEINNSFYRIPNRETIVHWTSQVPGRFRFAVKLWRGITQFRKLKNCREYLENFFQVFEPLPSRKRGPLLVQLPPNLQCDPGRLDAFLDDVRAASAPARWKIAVEFRHESWLCEEVYRLLDRQRAALCLHDMADHAPVDEPNDASFIYLRRHGPTGQYEAGYTRRQIERDAERIDRWHDAGKTVFVYYNNDVGGHAVRNARQLQESLGLVEPAAAAARASS